MKKLWSKFRLAWKVYTLTQEVTNMKPGARTTEFWITLIGSLNAMIGQYAGVIPEPYGIIATTILGAIYTIARTIYKSKAPEASAPKPTS